MNWFDFLWSYKVQRVKFGHGCDRSEKEVIKYGTTDSSKADLTVEISKLLSFAVAQLIWCSYIIQKATIFNQADCTSFFSKFPKSMTIQKWQINKPQNKLDSFGQSIFGDE